MRTGSASQLELAVAADVGTGSDAVFAWSVFLDFLDAGASDVFVAVRLRAGCAVECAVRI